MTLSPEEITEIYETARTLLPAARAVARRVQVAEHVAEDLLMDASIRVIDREQKRGMDDKIENLSSYIWTTYKHLLSLHIRKTSSEQEVPEKWLENLPAPADPWQVVTAAIFFEEVVRHLDERMKFVLERRLLSYKFEEIALLYESEFGTPIKANMLRTLYYRALQKLRKELFGP